MGKEGEEAPPKPAPEIRPLGRAKVLVHVRGGRRQADEEFVIRPVRPNDFEQLIHVQREVYPPPYVRSNHWTEELLQMHYMRFKEGQFCIEYVNDGTLVGSSVTMRIQRARARRKHSYASITGNQTLETHDPGGNALYGVDICISPHFRGKGLARALYDRRFALMRDLDLRHFLAGARIPGFARWLEKAKGGTVEKYVEKVAAGEHFDPTLTAQLHVGFKPVAILPKYMRDPDSADFAVLIEFEDPPPPAPAPAPEAKEAEAPKTEKSDKPEKEEKEKAEKGEKTEKSEKSEKEEKGDKSEKVGKVS